MKHLTLLIIAAVLTTPSIAFAASPTETECAAMGYVLWQKAEKSFADYDSAKAAAGASPSAADAEKINGLAMEADSLGAIADDLATLFDTTQVPSQDLLTRYNAMPVMALREAAIDCFP